MIGGKASQSATAFLESLQDAMRKLRETRPQYAQRHTTGLTGHAPPRPRAPIARGFHFALLVKGSDGRGTTIWASKSSGIRSAEP